MRNFFVAAEFRGGVENIRLGEILEKIPLAIFLRQGRQSCLHQRIPGLAFLHRDAKQFAKISKVAAKGSYIV